MGVCYKYNKRIVNIRLLNLFLWNLTVRVVSRFKDGRRSQPCTWMEPQSLRKLAGHLPNMTALYRHESDRTESNSTPNILKTLYHYNDSWRAVPLPRKRLQHTRKRIAVKKEISRQTSRGQL